VQVAVAVAVKEYFVYLDCYCHSYFL